MLIRGDHAINTQILSVNYIYFVMQLNSRCKVLKQIFNSIVDLLE